MQLGYDLFRDKDRLLSTFIPADVFDDTSPLTKLAGQINIIYTGSFFHLFDRDEQLAVGQRVVQLLVPQPGSLVIGRQVGNEEPGEFSRSGYLGERKRYRHNAESWKQLWDELGDKTGTKWSVEVDVDPINWGLFGPEVKLSAMRNESRAGWLHFVVRRL